jgi:hypothetical protein
VAGIQSARACVVIATFVLAGCAMAQNTPAQERTWQAIAKCKDLQPSGYQVTRVEPDGRYFYRSGDFAGGVRPWQDCIRAGGPR